MVEDLAVVKRLVNLRDLAERYGGVPYGVQT